jgi:hypothetical protein
MNESDSFLLAGLVPLGRRLWTLLNLKHVRKRSAYLADCLGSDSVPRD